MHRPRQAIRTLKSIGIDRQRLLFAASKAESDCRFVGGFRWDRVPLSGSAVNENEHGWLVAIVPLDDGDTVEAVRAELGEMVTRYDGKRQEHLHEAKRAANTTLESDLARMVRDYAGEFECSRSHFARDNRP